MIFFHKKKWNKKKKNWQARKHTSEYDCLFSIRLQFTWFSSLFLVLSTSSIDWHKRSKHALQEQNVACKMECAHIIIGKNVRLHNEMWEHNVLKTDDDDKTKKFIKCDK